MSGQRIGVLTAGGDAPGLNAAIRAIVRVALAGGDVPVGILNGWLGLVEDDGHRELSTADISGVLPLGGTLLGSSRTSPIGELDGLVDGVARLSLDSLIAIGGDGTLTLAVALAARGVHVVGVPKTIDRDLAHTEVCLGFASALSVVTDALDRLHTTAASHHQVMVLETMGRDSGWLCALGGLAGGADLVCIPEFPRSIDELADRVHERRHAGKLSTIVAVAEGAVLEGVDEPPVPLDALGHPQFARRAIGERVAVALAERARVETRSAVLGHLQRGGSPVASDRLWASLLGEAAVRVARGGEQSAVAVRHGQVVTTTLEELTATRPLVPRSLYDLCSALG